MLAHIYPLGCRIIGLSDGLTVPFALTAGLSSIGNSRIVVIGGVAELIAGAISMGIGGFREIHIIVKITPVVLIAFTLVASQAERDHFRYLRTHTRARVLRSCSGEMEREVHAVLGPVGIDEKLSRQVADSLLALEDEQAARALTSPTTGGERKSWFGSWSRKGAQSDGESGLRWSEDVGLTAFLLKFGEGLGELTVPVLSDGRLLIYILEEVPTARLYISAFTIGAGYVSSTSNDILY